MCLNVLKLPLDYRSTSWSQTSYWRSSEIYWAAAWSWCILLLACWFCRFFYILTLLVSFEFLNDISWANFIANSDPSNLFGDDFQRAQSRFRQVGNQIRRVRNQIRRSQKSDLYICHCVRPSFIQTCLSDLISKVTQLFFFFFLNLKPVLISLMISVPGYNLSRLPAFLSYFWWSENNWT